MILPSESLWTLKVQSTELTVQERKDAHLLIVFLNTYYDFNTAFLHLRKDWLSLIYPLPNRDNLKNYNVIKSGRSETMKRLKRIYKEYLVRVA